MEKLKIGMVGGSRATSYGSVFSNNPKTEVVALCEVDEEKLAENGKSFELPDSALYTSYEDLLNADIDVVVLGTPIPLHADQVVKALEAKKHVLSEVTAADTVENCSKIVDAVRKAKTKYMLAENCVFMDFSLQWKKWIDAGRIGTPFYAEADYVHEIRHLVEDKWRANRAPMHYCSHSLGPLLYWMDDYVVRATASGKHHSLTPETDGNIDVQVALFETAKGATIKVLRSSVALREPGLCTYSIMGDKGFLESGRHGYDNIGLRYFDGLDDKKQETRIAVSASDIEAPPEARLGGHGTSEYYLAQDFLNAIEFDLTPTLDVVRAMDMTVPGLIAHEAAMKGGVWMDVPRITD
ncbi:MAG: Gfo/Idh/MocA family oxidoreductase [Oscillospiraceae bacterium]|nr:Gfo/Idh/MocA family oxidoreductase [Oscillospiraceae bacterium]